MEIRVRELEKRTLRSSRRIVHVAQSEERAIVKSDRFRPLGMGETGDCSDNDVNRSEGMLRSSREPVTGRPFDQMGFRWRRCVANVLLGIILVSYCYVLGSNAQGSSGEFLSIDCGSPAKYEDSRGITWSTDSAYISTGQNAIVDTTDTDLGTDQSHVEQLRTLRSFPDFRKKHCYVIPEVLAKTLYLIRVKFLGANLTSAQSQNVTFGMTFNNYDYGNVTISDSFTTLVKELTFVTGEGPGLSICLVRKVGTPFISSLELRPLPYYMYQTARAGNSFVYKTIFRWNCGTAPNDSVVRYPTDPYDRVWDRDPPSFGFNKFSNFSAPIVNESTYVTPTIVLQSAWTSPLTGSLSFSWPVPAGTSNLIVFMYFAEITSVSSNDERVLDVYVNGEAVLGSPVAVTSTVGELYGLPVYTLNVSISPSTKSTLGAILNAVEAYSADFFNNSYNTLPADVQALTVIQEAFNLTDWTGDPCLPFSWEWLNCSSPDSTTISRILNIDLSSYNLTGTIPAEITQLTELNYLSLGNNNLTGDISNFAFPETLETLELQNNNLEGSIPDSWAELPNLHVLTLDNNMLSGNVPRGLLTKIQTNLLTFSASGNPDLCYGGNTACLTVLTPAPSPSESNITGASPKSNSSSNIGIIIGAIAGAVVLLLLAGTLFYLCRRRLLTSSASAGKTPGLTQMEQSHQGKSFSFVEVKAVTDNFAKVIGKGGFGVVYYGKLPDGEEVAVKVNKVTARTGQGTEEFLNEVALLSRVHHRNLVSLVGYCDDLDQQILIYVYMSEGTLREHLYGDTRRGIQLDWKTRLDIAYNAARGLEYLHNSCSPPIIHRDVKSSNILLTHQLLAKVADFGISKSTSETDRTRGVTTQIKGTHGYLDPEYFMEQRLTTKSDVYSFGVVLLELVTGRNPMETICREPGATAKYLQDWVQDSVRAGDIHAMIDSQMSANYNLESIWKVVELALLSLHQQGARRPDMQEIVGGLTQALELEKHHAHIPTTDRSSSPLLRGNFDSYQRVPHPSRESLSTKDSMATYSWGSYGAGR